MEPISHPAESGRDSTKLLDHLEDVAARARTFVPSDRQSAGGTSLDEYVAILAQCHDFGKATSYFQDYVRGERDSSVLTSHSMLGAYLVYYVLEERGFSGEERLIGFLAVARHHNHLPDVEEYVRDNSYWSNQSENANKQQQAVVDQTANISEHREEFATEFVDRITQGNGSWSEFASLVSNRDLSERIYEHVDAYSFASDRPEPSNRFYDRVLQAWSGLVLADKTSAAGVPLSSLEAGIVSTDILTEYISELSSNPGSGSMERALNNARSDARTDVLEGVDQFAGTESSVATLTLPTGLGKTLTGLNAAFRLRDTIDGKRVIYALPFTSIIDQVADEVKEIFDTDGTDDRLTVHHHLANTVTEVDGSEDTDQRSRMEEMLAESWRSGLTVTTFVQLFESLAGPRNTQSMKLPALYDSIIVLDEPQALPMDWWKLVRRLVDILTEEYGATVIAMTATQPELFGESFELVPDVDEYFDRFERVQYRIHESAHAYDDADSALEYERAGTEILDTLETNDSVLAVCNTIDSATALTEELERGTKTVNVGETLAENLQSDSFELKELVDEIAVDAGDDVVALVQLTTRHRPKDRLHLIEIIKRLTERDLSLAVVSTQLIEAGVDVSFEAVFRDVAPIDSVVQAAGRCNRSFESDSGRVTLWWLDAPEGTSTTPAQAVYDRSGISAVSLTVQTLARLGEGEEVEEITMTRDAVQEYYAGVAALNPGNPGYVDMVDDAEAEKLGELSLIDNRETVEVIVCRSPEDTRLVQSIRDAWDAREYDEVDTLLDKSKPLRVSIPIYRQESDEAEALRTLPKLHGETEVRVLDTRGDRFDSYFDPTRGLVVPGTTIDSRFL